MKMFQKKNIIFIISVLVIIFLGGIFMKNNSAINTFLANGEEKVPIHNICTKEKVVALTFDINWAEEEYLYDILDVLDKYNIKGTFFIMGKWVNYTEENKKKLEEIYKRGHEIGNHSYVHPDFKNISKDRMIEEIKKTEEIIKEGVGVKTELFRFPSGSYSKESLEVVESLGYKCIQWDVDSVDWRNDGEKIEFERVMKKVKEGSILLFHNNAKYTPRNLEKIIENLRNDKYEFMKISDILLNGNI